MMDINDVIEQCMNMMSGVMGSGLLFVVLAALLLVWLIGLAAIGGLGLWAYRRLRTHQADAFVQVIYKPSHKYLLEE